MKKFLTQPLSLLMLGVLIPIGASGQTPDVDMRILSWNLAQLNEYDRVEPRYVAGTIRALNPDLIAITSIRSRQIDNLKSELTRLGRPYRAIVTPNTTGTRVAVFYKSLVMQSVKSELIPYSGTQDRVSPKALGVRFKHEDFDFILIVANFRQGNSNLEDLDRKTQASAITDYIKANASGQSPILLAATHTGNEGKSVLTDFQSMSIPMRFAVPANRTPSHITRCLPFSGFLDDSVGFTKGHSHQYIKIPGFAATSPTELPEKLRCSRYRSRISYYLPLVTDYYLNALGTLDSRLANGPSIIYEPEPRPRETVVIEDQTDSDSVATIVERARNLLKEKTSELVLESHSSATETRKGYEFEAFDSALKEVKSELVNGFKEKRTLGLQAYARRAFPQATRTNSNSFIAPTGKLLIQKVAADQLLAQTSVMLDEIETSDNEVEITITSNPAEGATFELRSSPDGAQLINRFCAKSCLAPVTRGEYKYKIVKEGFRSDLFDLQLIKMPPRLKLNCTLVPFTSRDSATPCDLVPAQ
jgi:hypothetical protein